MRPEGGRKKVFDGAICELGRPLRKLESCRVGDNFLYLLYQKASGRKVDDM